MYKIIICLLFLVSCQSYRIDQSVIQSDKTIVNAHFNIEDFASDKFLLVDGIKITNPLCWGNKSLDDTETLQMALDSGANVIFIPKTPTPWITKPLFVPSNITIYFEDGSVIEALRGDFLGKSDSLISVHDRENVKISGYGARLKMWRKDYDKKPYENAQWRHSISIKSSSNIIIEGLTLQESGGDGVYLGQNGDTNKNIELRDLKILDHYRQGISVTSVNGLVIENVIVSGTKGHLPEAGIDFEPNSNSKELTDIEMSNCRFVNNKGPGFLVSLQNFSRESVPLDITVTDSIFQGSLFGLSIMNTKNDPIGNIVFNSVVFKGLKLNLPGKNLLVEFKK